jgi:hypothetical protein
MATTTTSVPSQLDVILSHIGMILEILTPIAQAASAPFVKNSQSQNILATEGVLSTAVGEALATV